MSSRKCVNDPDGFCYICGEFIPIKQQRSITSSVEVLYEKYFNRELSNLKKPWVPNKICNTCRSGLTHWKNGTRNSMPFGIPTIWREPTNHADDCYFCLSNDGKKIASFNTKNKHSIKYANVQSVTRPSPHTPENPIPEFKSKSLESDFDVEEEEEEEEDEYEKDRESKKRRQNDENSKNEDDFKVVYSSNELRSSFGKSSTFNQAELNDLNRDLGNTKDESMILASRLQEKGVLSQEVTFTWYKHREEEFIKYFSEEQSLVYCRDISGLITALGLKTYVPNEWRLFIDSSTQSFKAALLHNGNKYASVPVGYSTVLDEKYENMKLLLEKIDYKSHKWKICADFKVISILLGQQSGYTKFPCFLCEWDSRDDANHWTQKIWASRKSLKPGSMNILYKALVDPKNILLPPMHIKLGLMSQYVKALDPYSLCSQYLHKKFPKLSDAKIKAGIFIGPQIKQLCKDDHFKEIMSTKERKAWEAFEKVINGFLGNNKDPNYKQLVGNMLEEFKNLGCRMSQKLHFLYNHLDFFPDGKLGDVSDEQGERFHQDLKTIESRYPGRWNTVMIADYCWLLKREDLTTVHKRRSGKLRFLPT